MKSKIIICLQGFDYLKKKKFYLFNKDKDNLLGITFLKNQRYEENRKFYLNFKFSI
jgi:hypothetical protein